MKKKALVFIDFDVVIRHFIMSGAFDAVCREYDTTFVFHADATSSKKGLHADVDALGLEKAVRFELPRVRMGSWDKLYNVTALHNHRGAEVFHLRKALVAETRGKWRAHYLHLLSLPPFFPFVRRKLLRDMGIYQPLLDFVDREKPDILIHPSLLSGYFINELLQISALRRIPLLVLMNSWDNPSAKAMNTGVPTKLAVWGPQTHDHAVRYMRMDPDDVVPLGAAQFEVYRQPVTDSDEDLRRAFGVPAGLPCILYAGTSKSANDSRHLQMLDEAISAGRIPPCHLIYRPHPWRGPLVENERDFFELGLRHVTMDPHMADFYRRAISGKTLGFELANYRITRKLLHLVSGIVSPMSTILLEAAIVGKPALMFYPDPALERADQNFTLQVGSRMPHFRDFWGTPGIFMCHREAELADYCARMLAASKDPAVAEAQQAHARRFVNLDGPPYPEKLLHLVDEMVTHPAPARRADAA
jgi:hypothetical protein